MLKCRYTYIIKIVSPDFTSVCFCLKIPKRYLHTTTYCPQLWILPTVSSDWVGTAVSCHFSAFDANGLIYGGTCGSCWFLTTANFQQITKDWCELQIFCEPAESALNSAADVLFSGVVAAPESSKLCGYLSKKLTVETAAPIFPETRQDKWYKTVITVIYYNEPWK